MRARRPKRIYATWAVMRSVSRPTWVSSTTLARARAQTVDRFGGIDIVVNNAANALTQPLGQFTPEAWQKSFDVNLRGPVFLVQEALPYLERATTPRS